ncbi:MAG: hypothetical protein DHS20C18_00050 [Saprospiraceae bacterium]|nr:MAG: hypothetical protein DHS20C18_00050 [Saprospiraceae bacterium]
MSNVILISLNSTATKQLIFRGSLIALFLLLSLLGILSFPLGNIFHSGFGVGFASPQDSVIIMLEDFEVNKNHKYYQDFIQNQDPGFIKTLYYANADKRKQDGRFKVFNKNQPAKIVTDKGSKNSLIFTLRQGDKIWYDTLQNYVHLQVLEAGSPQHEALQHNLPIGSLPAGTTTAIKHTNSKAKITLELQKSAKTKIDILSPEKEFLESLVDKELKQGRHRFKWKKRGYAPGYYWLKIEVDGKVMSQQIEVED